LLGAVAPRFWLPRAAKIASRADAKVAMVKGLPGTVMSVTWLMVYASLLP
jgi:hypothetical protein